MVKENSLRILECETETLRTLKREVENSLKILECVVQQCWESLRVQRKNTCFREYEGEASAWSWSVKRNSLTILKWEAEQSQNPVVWKETVWGSWRVNRNCLRIPESEAEQSKVPKCGTEKSEDPGVWSREIWGSQSVMRDSLKVLSVKRKCLEILMWSRTIGGSLSEKRNSQRIHRCETEQLRIPEFEANMRILEWVRWLFIFN